MSQIRNVASCFLTLFILYIISVEGQTSTDGKVVVCYVTSWAVYRPQGGKFSIKDIKPTFCTHLIYSFMGLNETTWKIQSIDTWADEGLGNFKELKALRNSNPNLKISLAIGGFNEGSKKYSDLVSDKTKRAIFVESVNEFLEKHTFDGLDLDWEFPTERDGLPQDKQNFAELVQELHDKLAPKFILTAAISADKKIIDKAYAIPIISKYLDYIHLMAYDYHGSWDHKVLPNAPLYSDDGANINASVSHLLSLGVPPNKLVLGLPIYGRTHILVQNLVEGQNVIGMPTKDEAFSGPYTQEKGIMGYNEICLTLGSKTWTCGWDNVSNTPYAVNEKKVIVYDDHKSLQKKVMLANEFKLGGVMMWSIDTDDFSGICGNNFQMLRTVNAILHNQQLTNIENICKTSHASYNVQSLFYVIISILVLIRL